MLLSTSTYFVFLVGVFLLYWPLSKYRAGALAAILFANYFFLARWHLGLALLIPAASTIDYCIGLGLQSRKQVGVRRVLVFTSVLLNLSLIAAFRYSGITLPVSLSFYAFQSLTYTIDLYRRDIKGTQSYLAHLASVSFFPTMLAGPITRVSSLIDQFEKRKPLDDETAGRALFLIGLGMIKKLAIADYIAGNFVNRVFDFPNLYSSTEALAAMYAYAFQLYYDFSGYTDIALGSALLLGIKLPQNFNAPYSAENLTDFWRRWHISLSNWLRDYLYFSLPGLRSKWTILPYLNLVITMVIGGLWHGPTWNFVVWGALHGIGLAVIRAVQAWRGPRKPASWVRTLKIVGTFHFVTLAWVFFRAPTFEVASAVLGRLTSVSVSFSNISGGLWLVLGVALLGHYVPLKWFDGSVRLFSRAPFYAQAAALIALAIGLQNVAQSGAVPFIYNKF